MDPFTVTMPLRNSCREVPRLEGAALAGPPADEAPVPREVVDIARIRPGLEVVIATWDEQGDLSSQSRLRLGELAHRWADRLTAQGIGSWDTLTPAHCRGFMTAATRTGTPPQVHTQYARRTMMRTVLRTLRGIGVPVADPTVDLRLPPRPTGATRPLSDEEVLLGRATVSCLAARHAVVWALAETTAVSSEISALRLQDLDDPTTPSRVVLPGTARHQPRTGVLTPWGATVLAAHATQMIAIGSPPSALLTYTGSAVPGMHVAQSTVCNALGEALKAAGLSDDPRVRPGSVRAWAGRHVFDAGAGIDDVARALGTTSLDAAAACIGWSWHS